MYGGQQLGPAQQWPEGSVATGERQHQSGPGVLVPGVGRQQVEVPADGPGIVTGHEVQVR
jgi:hypothetical protein